MNFYNMMHGMNSFAALAVSPFLPRIPENFPRFRDVFIEENDTILIFCRMGGGNRECWKDCGDNLFNCLCPACDANFLQEHPNCIDRFDDDFDSTYCTFVFSISDEWKSDFDLLKNNKFEEMSKKYLQTLKQQYSGRETVLAVISSIFKEREERKENENCPA